MDDTYSEFMSRLSPCSSRMTMVSCDSSTPRSFRAEDFENLFSQRINELSKYGTLTEVSSAAEVKFNQIETEIVQPQAQLEVRAEEELQQPTHISLILADCSTVSVSLEDIKQFLAEYLHVEEIDIEALSVVHLIIYYYSHFSVAYINQIKLYHMGKPHSVSTAEDLCSRNSLINDLKIAQFPSFHLLINSNITSCPISLSLTEMVYQSFSLPCHQHYSVTYAEAIYYKLKSLKTKKSRRKRFHSLRAMLHI